jgi:hypothetical protein
MLTAYARIHLEVWQRIAEILWSDPFYVGKRRIFAPSPLNFSSMFS